MSLKQMIRGVLVFFLMNIAITGCTAEKNIRPETGALIEAGDRVEISYLCRLKNGEVAVSTEAVTDDQPRSAIYLAGSGKGPVSVTASGPDVSAVVMEGPIEDVVRDRLRGSIAGMKERETRRAELTSQDIFRATEKSHISRLARVRTRPKTLNVTVEDYRSRAGKEPGPGDPVVIDPDFPGMVDSFTGDNVFIKFIKPGDEIETIFGTGKISEEDDNYKVSIDAKKGALVRADDLIGVITDVDEKTITVDFRNPFGYETLICDVKALKVDKQEGHKVVKEENGK